jgi:hypothetical protein
LLLAAAFHAPVQASVDPDQRQRIESPFAKLPLAFEENKGQNGTDVRFMARGPGYKLFLTNRDAIIELPAGPDGGTSPEVIRMQFDGANARPLVTGRGMLNFKTNYFLGTGQSQQFTNVANHARVEYDSLYPGVDLVYYGKKQELEFDFHVAPRARPEQIKLRFSGMRAISVAKNGDLVLATGLGNLITHKPVAYQLTRGKRQHVDVAYVLGDNGQISFRVGKYDAGRALVIDPLVAYSFPFWGYANDVAVDPTGNVYVTGSTGSSSTNPTVLPATLAYQTSKAGDEDAYVVKLNASGTSVVYATYIGVRGASTTGQRVAVDSNGNAYIAGRTNGTGFPVTSGAYQTVFQASRTSAEKTSFILKLNSTGTALSYSTFFNGNSTTLNEESVVDIAVDTTGSLFIAGNATSVITTAGAFRGTNTSGYPSAFVAKLNASGTGLHYATYLVPDSLVGAEAVAIDSIGNAYIVGRSSSPNFPLVNPLSSETMGVFVTKLNPTGTQLIYSTIVGDGYGHDIAVDEAGQAHVVGTTQDGAFPVTAGVFQPRKGFSATPASNGFIVKMTRDGARIYSSFLGGDSCNCGETIYEFQDEALHVAVDKAGFAYVGGSARSMRFPAIDSVGGSFPVNSQSGDQWPYVAKISPTGEKLIYSSIIGGRWRDKKITGMAVDAAGAVHAIGRMTENGYPYADHVNTIPLWTGAPLGSAVSFAFKLTTGKYPTKVRTPAGPAAVGNEITLVADVTSTTVGGTVTFMSGGQTLGTASVIDGVAKLTTMLSRGSHAITAIYSGDGIASPAVFQIVNDQ